MRSIGIARLVGPHVKFLVIFVILLPEGYADESPFLWKGHIVLNDSIPELHFFQDGRAFPEVNGLLTLIFFRVYSPALKSQCSSVKGTTV